MGTRGLIGFAAEGKARMAYNHWDSYPSGLGLTALSIARDPAKLARLRDIDWRKVKSVDESAEPDEAEFDRLKALGHWQNVSSGRDYYALFRDLQGDPLALLECGYWFEGVEFAADSLFCEWAYVIDLDANALEVYEGFQKEPHAEGRFASMKPGTDGYYPVKLVGSVPLDDLPCDDEFVAMFDSDDEDEE